MNARNFSWLIVPVLTFYSCIIPKEARLLKRERKTFQEAPIVFEAYADSPFSGTFLTLRANNTFEYSSSGILKFFQAGDWRSEGDSLILLFRNSEMKETGTEIFLIDRKAHKLKRDLYDSSNVGGWRIMLDQL